VSFYFDHDDHVYQLDTEGGEIHWRQVDEPRDEPEQPLEPSED
jgi:hypothetical protein